MAPAASARTRTLVARIRAPCPSLRDDAASRDDVVGMLNPLGLKG